MLSGSSSMDPSVARVPSVTLDGRSLRLVFLITLQCTLSGPSPMDPSVDCVPSVTLSGRPLRTAFSVDIICPWSLSRQNPVII